MNPNQSNHRPITYKDFRIFNPDGSKKKGIIKAFLEEKEFTPFDLRNKYITISGSKLELIFNPEVREKLKKEPGCNCIISVQYRECGHYAIVELFRNNENQNDGGIND